MQHTSYLRQRSSATLPAFFVLTVNCLMLQVDVITMTGRCGNFDEQHPFNEYELDTWVNEEEHWNIIMEPSAKRYSYLRGMSICDVCCI
jgi:hypothetical protein